MLWSAKQNPSPDADALFDRVSRAIAQTLDPTGSGTVPPLTPEAYLGRDLGMSSLAVVRLAGLLQKSMGGTPLPFHTLFVTPDGTLLEDITIRDIVTFLETQVRNRAR